MSRRIRVSVEQSADVALIRSSIDNSFRVTEVHVRRIGDEGQGTGMQADFGEMTLTAVKASPIASISQH
jgi:hypothetical protein